MADAGDRIRIKYGLRNNPTSTQQQQWAAAVERLIGQGHTREEAGRLAAKETFSDFGTMFYASESDTIEMLLQRLRDN